MSKFSYRKAIVFSVCILLVVATMLSGCTASKEGISFTAGTYEGEGQGNNGPIKVSVTVDETKIIKVEVVENSETESIAAPAIESIPQQIVENQSISVDTISGATNVSNGIIEATKAALLAAGATEEQITKAVVKEGEGKVENLNADVVVIGAGGSGTAAAVTAAENGAKVIVVEKTAIPGGTTANGGGFFAADSQKSRDIGHEKLDINMIFEKYMEEMDWLADANLIKQFLELSNTTADWLQAHGVEFHKMEEAVQQSHAEGTNGYHKYNDFTKTSEQLGAMLEKIVKDNNAQVLYETPATELIAKDGVVTGVIAMGKDGTTYNITGKSVIVASGGFVGNTEMMKEALNGVTVNSLGYNTNVGDGINMSTEIGAATRSMSAMVLHTFSIDGSSVVKGEYDDPMATMYATSSLAYMPVIPWVNAEGFRFANEDIVYDRALSTNALISQGNYGWFIYNEELLNILESKGAAAAGMKDAIAMGPIPELTPINKGWSNLMENVEQMVDAGAVKKADNLKALAEATGMDVEILKSTMEAYNSDAKTGVDNQFGKDSEHMFNMSEGPYYAFRITANNLCTVGGVRINANLQVVLDDAENGYTPIKNLYAAGADASGIYSDHYAHTIEGAAQGWAYNSGRLAGARATENALGKTINLIK